MKMNVKKMMLTIMLAVILFAGNVNAKEDTTCSATSLNKLRRMAANVKVNYIPGVGTEHVDWGGPEGEGDVAYNYLDLKVYNITSKLYVMAVPSGSGITGSQPIVLSLNNVGRDGAATIRQKSQTSLMNYTFTIFSDAYGCTGQTLRTIRLTLPKFNYYSELGICQDVPEYYLCQPYTTYDVDGAVFYDKVNAYKAKVKEQDKKNDKEDDSNGVSGVVSSVSKYKYVIVGVITAIGVVVTIVIIKRKKSVL